ncbi:MAG TPA: hypothetical protein VF676_03100 [Flavobacterium sp.]|jgi:hypothetical protein
MNLINLVVDKLAEENIISENNGFSITYNLGGDAHVIIKDDIAYSDNKLAWFQTSSREDHLLRVFENNNNFNWIPETHNQSWGCECYLLEWFQEQLVFIYKEKHRTYVCAIKEGNVRLFKFLGEALERKKEIIYFQEYRDDEMFVRRLKIPELLQLDPISIESLREENLVPKSGVFWGGYLKGK